MGATTLSVPPAPMKMASSSEHRSERSEQLVSWSLSSFAVGVVQVRACRRKATRGVDTQGRRGRDTGSYVDRGERREVRAWAARSIKRLRLRDTRHGGMREPLSNVRQDFGPACESPSARA
jgi:hypothetical protein